MNRKEMVWSYVFSDTFIYHITRLERVMKDSGATKEEVKANMNHMGITARRLAKDIADLAVADLDGMLD